MIFISEGPLSLDSTYPQPNEHIGEKYTFRVSTPSGTSTILAPLYNLNWFYNGGKIYNSSDSLITNDNSTLTTVVKEGTYEVRYEGLKILPYDKTCEENILKYMSGYAGFRSVQFQVNSKGNVLNHSMTNSPIPTYTHTYIHPYLHTPIPTYTRTHTQWILLSLLCRYN